MRPLAAALTLLLVGAAAPPPHASHVTIVVMENRSAEKIVASPDAPYFNGVLRPQGLLLTDSHAVAHPSEPNYLALFSGSTHGLADDRCPVAYGGPNLAWELKSAGHTFAGYAESMPSDGYRGCWAASYARKHVPWIDFENVPPEESRVYRGQLPIGTSVAWIVPNLCHDMHDCSTRAGDTWMSRNLPKLVAWNASHDGLLVVTWDEAEPDDGSNRIPTLLVGPMVRRGTSAQRVDHYGVLRTVEAIFGLGCIDRDCATKPIAGVWR